VELDAADARALGLIAIANDVAQRLSTGVDGIDAAVLGLLEMAVYASAISAPVAKDEMLLLWVATDTNVEVPVLLAVPRHSVPATIKGPGGSISTATAVPYADGLEPPYPAGVEAMGGTGIDSAMNPTERSDVDASAPMLLTVISEVGGLLLKTDVDRVGGAVLVTLEVADESNAYGMAAPVAVETVHCLRLQQAKLQMC